MVRGGERGSVLVEALVASALVALVLALAYRAMGEGTLRARAAEEGRLATLIAQSRLASVGGEIPLADGETRGLDGAFQWRVEVRRTADADSAAGDLYAVTVAVQDRKGGADRAALRTLRLGPAT
jgi:general secretion pathway protein I